MVAAELDTVIVVDLAPEPLGSKVSWPVVQLVPAASVLFAVQAPGAWLNSASLLENGVAPRVTGPPFAVRVTVPQFSVVPTPSLAQDRLAGDTVR